MPGSSPRPISQLAVAVALGVPAAMLVILLLLRGGAATWDLWHIKAASPPFLDSRVFTAAAESWHQGFDPLLENPADSSHRPLNYPRVWHLLFPLGLGPQHANAFGATLILLFTAGLTGFMLRHRDVSPWWFTAAVFSPAILLGVERGNIDLGVFALIAFALIALETGRARTATVAIVAAGVLKLFPFAALAALPDASSSRRNRCFAAGLVAAALYLIFIYHDLGLIRAATPPAAWYAYGWSVLPDLVATHLPERLPLARIATALGLVVAGIAALAGWHRAQPTSDRSAAESDRALAAFRVGAATYVGTFLLGGNFNYRLAFLLFALPQLVRWSRPTDRRPAALLALASLYVGLWIGCFEPRAQTLTSTADWSIHLVGEAAQWLLFTALAWLLGTCLPDWLRPSWRRWARPLTRLQVVDVAVVSFGLTLVGWQATRAPVPVSLRPLDSEEVLLVAAAAVHPGALAPADGVDLVGLGPVSLAPLQISLPLPVAPADRAPGLALALLGLTALLGYVALRQRHPSRSALLALLPGVATLALLCLLGQADRWRASTLAACLLANAAWLFLLARDAAPPVVRRTAAALAAALVAVLPFVSLPGVGLAVAASATAFWILRRDSELRTAAAWGGGVATLSGLAWLHGFDRWSLVAESYSPDALRPAGFSVALWSRTLASISLTAVLVGASIGLAGLATRRRVLGIAVGLPVAMAISGLALLLSSPSRPSSPLDVVAQRMSQEAGGRGGDHLAVWGSSTALHRLAAKPPVLTWIIPRKAADPRNSAARARYLAGFRSALPAYFADTTAFDADPALLPHESFPALADFIRENYTLLLEHRGVRLYLHSRLARERNVLRPGIVPVRLETLTRRDAKVPPQYLPEFQHNTRIFTHAAAHYSHPVPAGATRLRGAFGVLPTAYEKPDAHTDGGIFIVEAVEADGRRQRLLEQALDPFAHPADRGDHVFDLALPASLGPRQIDLIVDPRGGEAFDWMYWADLNFAVETVAP